MSVLARLLGGGAAAEPTSADIRGAIAKANAELKTSGEARATRRRERARILVTGTDDDLHKHDRNVADAELQHERLTATVRHLEAELVEAGARGAGQALEELVETAGVAAARYEKNLKSVGALNTKLVPLMEALAADHDQILGIFRRLRNTDLAERIVFLDHEIRPTNRPVHQVAVVPEVFEGQGWYRPPHSSATVRFLKPAKVYDGPIHEVPPLPVVTNEAGEEMHGGGRLVGPSVQ